MIVSRIRRLASRFLRPATTTQPSAIAPRRWIDELADAGLSSDAWIGRRLGRNALYVNVSDAGLDRLRQQHPLLVQATLDAAGRILRHEFDLLGSGPYVPDDPDRSSHPDGYRPIDWHLDPVSGLRFPPGVPLTEWDFARLRPGLADIKLPWELARCQHWPLLGQAYRLTGDDRFAIEIARELQDFMEGNPIATGVNWTCTMDVALRAANWAIGLELVRDCASLGPAFWEDAYRALFDHGTFIEGHLEINYGVTSNHFLSNVVGLFFLAVVFDDLPRGRLWNRQCRGWLTEEMAVQVLPDGADFESSVTYHRLVTELFLAAARLADYTGAPLSPAMRRRVHGMVAYLEAVLRPDGLMPQVGDADDGRAHMLSAYGNWQPQDPGHIFGPAGCFFGNPAWTARGGEWMPWETAWWGFDPPETTTQQPPADGFQHFPNAGVTVMRRGRDYLVVTNGIVGTNGYGNHKHNDLLGFEYHVDAVALLVDPGSYLYTSNPELRNAFRSTRSHNTLSIDGEEQNELIPDQLFRLFEKAAPEHLEICRQSEGLTYRGRHRGYTRLPQPIVHERMFTWSWRDDSLTIADVLYGEGAHRIRWHFHFAPGVEVLLAPDGSVQARGGNVTLGLATPAGLQATVCDAWYSPSYGVRSACRALEFEIEAAIPGRAEYLWRLTPSTDRQSTR
ncbi:MAG TPA: alginate lyase family protein [Vicinamibacterales bacterium]|nr:alginate lyase family protein [Vicinamibacterales bacterium]